MTFPTSDQLSSFALFLRLTSLRDAVVAARPDLDHLTSVHEARPLGLVLNLPDDSSGYWQRVSMSRTHNAWIIAFPRQTTIETSAWDLATEDRTLRDAFLAVYDAWNAATPLPSPWRWAESERNLAVEVADELVDKGLDVDAVVSGNRLVPGVPGTEPRHVAGDLGDAIRIRLEDGSVTLAENPHLGWVLDVGDGLTAHRVDLAAGATGQPSSHPGYITDDPRHLADVVVRLLADREWPGDARPPFELCMAESPLREAVAWWMRRLGYPTAAVRGGDLRADQHVLLVERRCTLGHVQRGFADATVAGKALFVFSTKGYTRDARNWATRAKVPLFELWDEDYSLTASSPLAAAHLPCTI